jgi:hypothetical protein
VIIYKEAELIIIYWGLAMCQRWLAEHKGTQSLPLRKSPDKEKRQMHLALPFKEVMVFMSPWQEAVCVCVCVVSQIAITDLTIAFDHQVIGLCSQKVEKYPQWALKKHH